MVEFDGTGTCLHQVAFRRQHKQLTFRNAGALNLAVCIEQRFHGLLRRCDDDLAVDGKTEIRTVVEGIDINIVLAVVLDVIERFVARAKPIKRPRRRGHCHDLVLGFLANVALYDDN